MYLLLLINRISQYDLGYFSVAFEATLKHSPVLQRNDPVKFNIVRLNDGDG